MRDPKDAYAEVKKDLNNVSPSFCAAKWTQVTLHLHNGRTHSCHHPRTHLVPLDELAKDPSALHNTQFKKQQRKDMIDGKRPTECQYCWNVEDLPNYDKDEFFSDRVAKSAAPWSADRMGEIVNNVPERNINPSYVEVSFSNICNFKCSYCSPVYSSRWTEEIEHHGPYPTSGKFNNLEWYRANKEMPIHHKEHNPYVEAFWDWWPSLVKDLRIFRITGGEPLLANDTFKVLDFLSERPQPQLELAVNTNACVPDSKLNPFMEKVKHLIVEKKIKSFNLFTSVDAAGAAAEYGRFGLDYKRWYATIDQFLTEIPDCRVTIMSTANVFSITTYTTLLSDLLGLKAKHGTTRLSLDISILRYPHHQCLSILTNEHKNDLDPAMEFMKANTDTSKAGHFMHYEILHLERLINFTKAPPHRNENISINAARRDFAVFVDEHDKRRGTNFISTFPELAQFYQLCKTIVVK
jgi:organic radical activating enzyme